MANYDRIQFRKPTANPIFRTKYPGVLAQDIPTGGADGDSVLSNDTGYVTDDRVHARLVTPVSGVTFRGDGSGEYPSGPAINFVYELSINGVLDDTASVFLVDAPTGGNESLLNNGQHRFTGLVPTAVTSENNFANLLVGQRRYVGLVPSAENTEDKFSDLPAGAQHRFTGLPLTAVVTNDSQLEAGTIQFQGLQLLASVTDGDASNLSAGQMQFQGQPLTVSNTETDEVLLESGTLQLQGLAPLASVTDGDASNLSAGQNQFQGFALTVETSDQDEVLLPLGALQMQGFAPTVDAVVPNVSDLLDGEMRFTGQPLTVQFTSPIPDTHRVEAILEAIAANVSAGFPAGEVVRTRRRPLPIDKEREVNVTAGADEAVAPDDGNFWFIDSLLTVYVDIARREDVYIETDLNTDRMVVHQQVMADRTQGLAYVHDTRYGGSDDPEISEEGDEPVGSLRTIWTVYYRMDADNPVA